MKAEQIGIACWGLREIPLEEQLRLTQRLNGSFMELGIANAPRDLPLRATTAELAGVRNLFDKYHIPLEYAATGNNFTAESEAEVRAEVEKVRTVIGICEALQISWLRIFAGFSPADKVSGVCFDNMADALLNVAAYASQHGVQLAIELHGGVTAHSVGVEHFHSVTTRHDKLETLLRVLPKEVSFVLDPANLWAVGITEPEQYYQWLSDRIAYIHLKDFQPLPSGYIMPSACGTSRLNWQSFLDYTRDFTGPLLIEYENPEDVEHGMRESINYIKSLL